MFFFPLSFFENWKKKKFFTEYVEKKKKIEKEKKITSWRSGWNPPDCSQIFLEDFNFKKKSVKRKKKKTKNKAVNPNAVLRYS